MKTFIVGYSSDPERFSNKAYKMLKEYGHQAVKINPREDDGAFKSINDGLKRHNHPHTITMYVNRSISSKLKEEILKAHPKRVVFNPGAENPELESELKSNGIEIINDCTLIMLQSGHF